MNDDWKCDLILRYYPLTFYATPPTHFNSFLPHLP